MANEKRLDLIDRKKLLEKGYWHGKRPDLENPFEEGVDAVDTIDIENAPTVDAVEVVRCKDCKHYNESEQGCDHFGYYSHTPYVDEDDFCSYGERRTDER